MNIRLNINKYYETNGDGIEGEYEGDCKEYEYVLTPSFMHVNILPSRKTLPTDVAKVGVHNYPKTILTIRIMTL